MSIADLAVWLESTAVAALVRESAWGFPIVVALHIVGITLSVGMIMWFDLRLLGVVLRDTPVSRVYRGVIPPVPARNPEGGPAGFTIPQQPDSSPIVRADFDTRRMLRMTSGGRNASTQSCETADKNVCPTGGKRS